MYLTLGASVMLKMPGVNYCWWSILAASMQLFKFQSGADHTGHLIMVPKA